MTVDELIAVLQALDHVERKRTVCMWVDKSGPSVPIDGFMLIGFTKLVFTV